MVRTSSVVHLFTFALSLLASASLAMLGAQALTLPQLRLKFPNHLCDVVKYGAVGIHDTAENFIGFDTAAFQRAIDSCAASGGGIVRVPRGNYIIGPIFLRSNIELEIDKYAEIAAGTDPALFHTTDKTFVSVTDTGARRATTVALINIRNSHNVAIIGDGLIDGQGAVWWERLLAVYRSDKRFWTDGQVRQQGRGLSPIERISRPRLVEALNSQELLFKGVTLENSPSFHLMLQNCDNVAIRDMHIEAPFFSFNTDAIDPINSRNVLIANNVLSTGDDLVAIKSGGYDPKHPDAVSKNIIIRDNIILHGAGIAIGSGVSGGVKHVLVENNSFNGTMFGVRIKSSRGRGGEVSDITFHNNRMINVETPFALASYYAYRPLDPKEAARQAAADGGFLLNWDIYPGSLDSAHLFLANKTPNFHEITIDGLTATGADRVGIVVGLPEKNIGGLYLKNVHIRADTGLLVRNATVNAQNTSFNVRKGNPILLQTNGTFREGDN